MARLITDVNTTVEGLSSERTDRSIGPSGTRAEWRSPSGYRDLTHSARVPYAVDGRRISESAVVWPGSLIAKRVDTSRHSLQVDRLAYVAARAPKPLDESRSVADQPHHPSCSS